MKGRSTSISRKPAVLVASLIAAVIISALMASGIPRFSLGTSQRVAAQQVPTATPTPAATPTATATASGQCELWVDKWDSPDPVAEGGQITYSIEVDNDGDGACSDLTVVDTIPDGTDCVSASVDIDSDIAPGDFLIEGCDTAGDVYWTTDVNLNDGDYVVVDMVVQLTLDAEDGDHITNEACATSSSDTSGDCDTAQTTVGVAGSISGTVTDSQGNPLQYCEVEAGSLERGVDRGDGETDQDGSYLISGLVAADYLVQVWCDGYLEEYYDGARSEDDATPVVVVGGQDASGIDFALSSGGTITGFVRDAYDNPVTGASVVAELVSGDSWQAWPTSTNPDGSYSIVTLVGGDYRVSAGATGYAFEYYADANWQEEATPVSVTEGSTTSGISFVLHAGGSISGTVTDSSGGPIEGAMVLCEPIGHQLLWWWGYSRRAISAADSSYTTADWPDGEYRCWASANGYFQEYYDGARESIDATPVTITAGENHAGIDFALDHGAIITGRVTDASSGVPVPDAYVHASGEHTGTSVYTDENGDYVFGDTWAIPGDCYVLYADGAGYVREYYDGVRNWDDATRVCVSEGETASGINFSLDLGGTISGTVTDSLGKPLGDCDVYADSWDGEGSSGYGYTDGDGIYAITGLATDDYRVDVECEGYVDEYYDNVRNWDDATPVPVVEGQEHAGIDFRLELGGTISGTVTDSLGKPLGDCDVYAGSWDGEGSSGYGYTDGAGIYAITGLATDDYRVDVECEGYVDEYYDNVRNWDDVTPVPVVEGQEHAGIDFRLELGGTISGTVSDAQGNPIEDCWVYADPWDGSDGRGYGYTGVDGTYTADGLATGDYRVYVHCEGYVREYYNGVRQGRNATPVHVAEGQEHAGIDFILHLGGTISGTVTDTGGQPLKDCSVSARPWSGSGTSENGQTDYDGTYAIVGLATNNYLVYVDCDGYASEYYDGVYDPDDATPVHVVEGLNTPDIDFSLHVEGTISGTVEDADGDPIAGATVCANGDDIESCDWTDNNGDYEIGGLIDGDYIVNAKPAAYVREYYENVRSESDATPVSVTEGEDTPRIDFTLDLGGTVPALITDAGGDPIQGAWALASPSQTVFTKAISPPAIPKDGGICWTNADGECTIRGLATGNYIISASAPNYLTSYFDGATSEGDADPVFVEEGEETPVDLTLDPVGCGDTNEDRRTGIVDAMLIAQYVAGLIGGGDLNLTVADVNSSGGVSMVDAMMIAQKVAGLIDDLSCNLPPVATPTATATPGP